MVASGLPLNMSDTRAPGGSVVGAHGAGDVLVGEVEHGQLIAAGVVELVDHHEHAAMGDLGNVDLAAGRNSVVRANPQDGLQLPHEAGLVGELVGDRAVEAAPARHPGHRLGGTRR